MNKQIKIKPTWKLYHGDSAHVLKHIPSNSIDALVSDPPAGIAFMNKSWDKDKGGREQWIKWLADLMKEAYRTMKPGAHGLVWALPKTSHWTATALEDAGFEIRDVITHHFGSGFPKNHDVSKAIDKKANAKREVVGYSNSGVKRIKKMAVKHGDRKRMGDAASNYGLSPITAAATPEARQWEGFGTALKPATENWIMIRKPFKGSVAQNVLKHGTGAINIDAARVKHQEECKMIKPQDPNTLHNPKLQQGGRHKEVLELKPSGRWPANLVLSHHPDCVLEGTKEVTRDIRNITKKPNDGVFGLGSGSESRSTEEVADWKCVDGCPVRILGEQSGVLKSGELKPGHVQHGFDGVYSKRKNAVIKKSYGGDKGTAARFFQQFHPIEHEPGFLYQPKPSKKERSIGCEMPNNHPTVKSVQLMRYLARLITPPGGTILDPFMGSGSTGVAAIKEGFSFVGIEAELEYIHIAKNRIEFIHKKGKP